MLAEGSVFTVPGTSANALLEIQRLLRDYETEITNKKRQGLLMENAAKTYLLHSTNFVRWIRGEFNPGERNEGRVRR